MALDLPEYLHLSEEDLTRKWIAIECGRMRFSDNRAEGRPFGLVVGMFVLAKVQTWSFQPAKDLLSENRLRVFETAEFNAFP
jgi:hypothetical protein